MNARHARKIRQELREGMAAGKAHAENLARMRIGPTTHWTVYAPRHFDTPYSHGKVSGFKRRYKELETSRKLAAAADSVRLTKSLQARREMQLAHAKMEQARIDSDARNPDLSFIQLYTEGLEVRVTTYLGGEHSSTILVDPDRAESLGHQFLTEAARARSKRNGADDGSSSGSGRRQQQRVGETG